MLTLYSAELLPQEAEKIFDRMPDVSRTKLAGRRDRTGAVAGELLRLRMMEACGAPPEYGVGIHGKPYSPARPDISYNISHCRNLAVGALLTGCAGEVGVDVEYIDRKNIKRQKRVAERFFTQTERAQIAGAPDTAMQFYIIWTRKESYLKYKGTGFSSAVAGVDVTNVADAVFDCRIIGDRDGGEYAFAVCFGKNVSGPDKATICKIY